MLVHAIRIPCLKGTVGVIIYILRTPHHLEKKEGIPDIGRQMIMAARSEGMSAEEFLGNTFTSKMKYFYAVLWK